MNEVCTRKRGITLRERIEALPNDSVLFRSDFPEYHSEFVGDTLATLTKEGVLVKFMPSLGLVGSVWLYPPLIKLFQQSLPEIEPRFCLRVKRL